MIRKKRIYWNKFGKQNLNELEVVKKSLKQLENNRPPKPVAMAVVDKKISGDIPLSIRGVVHNKGQIVPRGVLQVCSEAAFPLVSKSNSGRMELAQWMTDRSHPLTARVIVNRIWHWVFGAGLVRTVDNFGTMGDRPSHPELLDYLAVRFVEEGWSVKKLIRQMMLSRTYWMSTNQSVIATETDPENRQLSRMNRQRLDAESLRDTLLLLGGKLETQAGGPAIAEGTKSEYGYKFESNRRSVYLPVFRNRLPQIFEVFDFADPNIQVGSRTRSTTVPQAHFLMNNPFVVELSDAAPARLLSRSELNGNERLRWVFLQVLGRVPSEVEAKLARDILSNSNSETRSWSMLYQSLFQSIDFRYLN